jgi:hypothetical protein
MGSQSRRVQPRRAGARPTRYTLFRLMRRRSAVPACRDGACAGKNTFLRAQSGTRPGSCAGKTKKSSRRPNVFLVCLLILCALCASVVKCTRLRAQTCPEPVSTESASGARAKPHR